MDEEFFFPQNVRTTYRLWILGPRHLKRLALAPLIALAVGWLFVGVSLFLAALLAALFASAYAGLCCVPVLAEERTAWDVWQELRRHQKGQAVFAHQREEEANDFAFADPDELEP